MNHTPTPDIVTPDRFAAARDYLCAHGRPLEQSLLAHHFDAGPVEPVLEALAGFQYSDGGYGHGLEPDGWLNRSTVLDTTRALQVHRRLGTPTEHPQVCGAVAYLLDTFDPARRIWPIKPATAPDAPGAPWWQAESLDALINRFGGCRLNPRAEVLAHVHDHAALVPARFLPALTEEVADELEAQPDRMEQHDLACCVWLSETTALEPNLRQRIIAKLQQALPASIEPDRTRWDGYGLKPLTAVTHPHSPLLAGIDSDLITAHLDYEVARQDGDGAWQPTWNWGDANPELWERARLAWASILTFETLVMLDAFDRVKRT